MGLYIWDPHSRILWPDDDVGHKERPACPTTLRGAVYGLYSGLGEVGMEYAIAGTYMEFMAWRRQDPKGRASVVYLTAQRATEHRTPGTLYRIGTWQDSPALEVAERLEAK